VICAGDVPDHVTICRFRSDFGDRAGELFGEVLVLCARLGMGKLGVIALDGMKITAAADILGADSVYRLPSRPHIRAAVRARRR